MRKLTKSQADILGKRLNDTRKHPRSYFHMKDVVEMIENGTPNKDILHYVETTTLCAKYYTEVKEYLKLIEFIN